MSEVGFYSRKGAVREHALVLAALGIRHEIVSAEVGFVLRVAPEDLSRAREQIRLYEEENRPRTPGEEAVLILTYGWAGALTYAVLLILFFLLDHGAVLDLPWARQGSLAAGPVREGEWWRTVTALTLHVDFPHLCSNLVFGACFVALVCQLLGTGVGLCGVLLSGVLGNVLDALGRPPGFLAMGASTAVFGAVGLVAGTLWFERGRRRRGKLRVLAPLVVGIVLLAWYGMSGERTDIVAHCTGMAAGIVLGIVCGIWRQELSLRRTPQILLGSSALALVTVAWVRALAGG